MTRSGRADAPGGPSRCHGSRSDTHETHVVRPGRMPRGTTALSRSPALPRAASAARPLRMRTPKDGPESRRRAPGQAGRRSRRKRSRRMRTPSRYRRDVPRTWYTRLPWSGQVNEGRAAGDVPRRIQTWYMHSAWSDGLYIPHVPLVPGNRNLYIRVGDVSIEVAGSRAEPPDDPSESLLRRGSR